MLSVKFWKTYFKYYDRLNELYPYQSLVRDLAVALEANKGKLILDAGAGTGNVAVEVFHQGSDVVALDFSKEGLEILKSKLPKAQLVLADLNKSLPFADNTFDGVCTNNTLYTLPSENRRGVLREFFRIMKPGGVVVISNIKKGFKPFAIYTSHIKEERQRSGLIITLFKIFKFMWPTIMIFYCNWLIKRENKGGGYNFFEEGEQRRLMLRAGFTDISDDIIVYAGQAILNKGYKPANS